MKRIGLLIAGVVAADPALAADVEARSRIDSITVFPDAAQVTRVMEIDLPPGASTVIVKGVPIAADPNSLGASGEATGGKVAISSVEARVAPADAKPGDSSIEARLKNLRSDREGWQATIDALVGKQAMIKHYAQASPEKLSADSNPLPIDQWNAAFDKIGAALAKVGDELRAANARAREIDEEIKGLEASAGRARPKAAVRDIAIAVEAAAPTKARLSLVYRVSGAGWRPAYEARLDTGRPGVKPAVDLVRRAIVAQRTGEDWSDVALTLSTSRALRGAGAPDVQPERIAFWEPPIAYAPAPAAKAMRADAVREKADNEAARREAGGAQPAAPVEEKQAALEANAWSARFVAPGRVAVPTDGSTRNFQLSTRRYEPALTVKSAPAFDPTAYLETRLTNEEEAPLIAGEVAVQRDGAFVGMARLQTTAPGEAFDLGFGADDRVRVARVPVKRKENEPTWLGQTKTDAREFKTTVRNLHDFPVRVAIVDRIPFSENSAISVELLQQTTQPTEKQIGDRRGVMGWTFDLAPQEQKELRLAWRMKWPADRDIVFQPAPLPAVR